MTDGIKVLGKDRFQLCGTNGCCPEVKIDENTGSMQITDDDGGTATLTKEQALLFKALVSEKFPD